MSFSIFNFSDKLNKSITNNGYTKPTAIQEQVIPLVLQKHDILAKAQTGSGKSASFVLPILEYISHNPSAGKSKIKVLVLTPTRELALQITNYFNSFSVNLEKVPKVVTLIGGESLGDQISSIQQGCDILVATPGRFIDILSKKQTNFEKLKFLVVDEADKMLDLGFNDQLDLILQSIPEKRQTLLFSATYPPRVLDIAKKLTLNPKEVIFEEETETVDTITQRAIEVNVENKRALLKHLLKINRFDQVLIFMVSARAADNIANKFQRDGYPAQSLHGKLDQEERNLTLDEFRSKKIRILFTTDLLARGIDIDDISCVINFDLPRSPADYIHRIGRTGRAGKNGIAISLVSHEDKEHFKLIEKRCDIDLNKEQIAGFELVGEAPKKEKGTAPVKGKRKSKKDKLREEKLKQVKENKN
ncbi:MAG: DEAD/DEAH box helicase [Campylobacteraceae bacterium]|jgi:superfamily II DNA/RNA helicase|nr:DEAD/DEAH box helicase [Campylobacteraceae bacterium]MBT3881807.1 DEAD/DEAH box helicase [Campylobacteraceae bacterium]MBT4030574.1 DEAD/DEAH box helicase [Campylobacteraceae bacterium]MBT4179307.1 DEAD/DEAH box helicase [Campylobacteraceae bacterium]MBT4572427.1 DEAD/DEAH box helicase [Campylobacteraceae bacterium]